MVFKMRSLLVAVIFGMVLPGLLLSISEKIYWRYIEMNITQPKPTEAPIMGEQIVSVLMKDDSVQKMVIEDYLTSVLLREMPAKFELEALKAQAVVARTYTLRRCNEGSRHENADICTDASCCQAYWDVNAYLLAGGKNGNIEKIRNAVLQTGNEVLCYNGTLIDATYFSCSGGVTEDAVAVWGNEVPYLRSVESPGEESAKHYVDTITFTKDEFMRRLDIVNDVNVLSVEEIQYTSGGGIDTVKICGVSLRGTVIRKKLGLNSTAMLINVVGDVVTITTKGKGHRVGMSQYGADAMARKGADYKEILSHYYYNTEVVTYMPD